jgi:hypothetical protein
MPEGAFNGFNMLDLVLAMSQIEHRRAGRGQRLVPYTPQQSQDGSAAHPASAARFTHIEQGLDATANVADSARSSINAHAALTTTAPGKRSRQVDFLASRAATICSRKTSVLSSFESTFFD